MWSDPIADMLTRIRNGLRCRRRHVMIPSSKMKIGVARVLKEEGYINDFDVIEDKRQGMLRVHLKYGPRGEEVLRVIRRESKPSCRVYRGVDELPKVMDGLGICVVSTPQGVLSDRQCREKKVGGELICTVA
jgi:small subunit ribosomal protein S8